MNRKRSQLRKFIKENSDQPWNKVCRKKTNFNKGTGRRDHLEYQMTVDDIAATVDYMLVLAARVAKLEKMLVRKYDGPGPNGTRYD